MDRGGSGQDRYFWRHYAEVLCPAVDDVGCGNDDDDMGLHINYASMGTVNT